MKPTKQLSPDAMFFFDRAGHSHDPRTQTEAEGRTATAETLAGSERAYLDAHRCAGANAKWIIMTDLYSNPAVREHAELLVRRAVCYCVSSLVYSLTKSEDAQKALGVDVDDLMAVCSCNDWEEPAREYIRSASDEIIASGCEYFGIKADSKQALLAHLEASDNWQDYCENERIEAYIVEAYEHWIVTDWFASKLEERGEMIARDLLGLTIWGRATSGQSIAMDSVILEIARNALMAAA